MAEFWAGTEAQLRGDIQETAEGYDVVLRGADELDVSVEDNSLRVAGVIIPSPPVQDKILALAKRRALRHGHGRITEEDVIAASKGRFGRVDEGRAPPGERRRGHGDARVSAAGMWSSACRAGRRLGAASAAPSTRTTAARCSASRATRLSAPTPTKFTVPPFSRCARAAGSCRKVEAADVHAMAPMIVGRAESVV